ncbi:MAG: hypothetical protein JWM99_3409 [Verrucomicrobiales bacterium]|nr:hypothetical protein [Verrucomicrobiales bacterium]
MKTSTYLKLFLLALACFFAVSQTATAQSDIPMPDVIKKGLALYEKGGVIVAFDSWQRGGMLENDSAGAAKLRAFKEMTTAIGNYKSSDVVRVRQISNHSRLVYFAMNFNRGVIYAKFLIYQTESDWNVQNMVFGSRPETIMPWLALESENEGQ